MQHERTTGRRRPRALLTLGVALLATGTGILVPSTASAVPGSSSDARTLVEQAAQQMTVIDEQVRQAEIIVARQQQTAQEAAAEAAKAHQALSAYEPQLRAIAQSGYTGKTQSRVQAFLTSQSAADLVQQMTTLDLIASHTNALITDVARAQAAAQQAQAAADQSAAQAEGGLAQLQAQKAEVQKKAEAYQADFARLSAAEQAAVTAAVAGPTLKAPANLPLASSEAAAIAIRTALAQIGKPYAYGASGPNSFDCSGLTSFAYAAAGVTLPHSSRAQAELGREVSRAGLQPGDLVYFYTPVSHVGLYIGNGMMVHARTYGSPVAVTSVDQAGYRGARRIVGN